ncbi:MAG: hypothetical protein ACK56F_05375 [bacterium]
MPRLLMYGTCTCTSSRLSHSPYQTSWTSFHPHRERVVAKSPSVGAE